MTTWKLTITPHSIPNKTGRIVGVRTDDIAGTVDTVVVPKAKLDTGPQQAAALNLLWNKWLVLKARNEAVIAFIGNLEITGATNLEARE